VAGAGVAGAGVAGAAGGAAGGAGVAGVEIAGGVGAVVEAVDPPPNQPAHQARRIRITTTMPAPHQRRLSLMSMEAPLSVIESVMRVSPRPWSVNARGCGKTDRVPPRIRPERPKNPVRLSRANSTNGIADYSELARKFPRPPRLGPFKG
jgi:hypothetical protein